MSEQSSAQPPSGRTRRRRSDDHLFLSKFVRCRAALVGLFWLPRSYLSKKKKEEQVSIASTTQSLRFVRHSRGGDYLQWDVLLEDLRREEGSDNLYSSVNEHCLGSVNAGRRRGHLDGNRSTRFGWGRWGRGGGGWRRTWSSFEVCVCEAQNKRVVSS